MLNTCVHSSRTSLSIDTAEAFNRLFANVGLKVRKMVDFCIPVILNQKMFSIFFQKVSILEVIDISSSLSKSFHRECKMYKTLS